ncbi:MAG: thioredoxin domain-containing protein [Caldilineaceae bacterium]|nr:thioredoxin domain-containing protein [Caldilineaceae bacterium]
MEKSQAHPGRPSAHKLALGASLMALLLLLAACTMPAITSAPDGESATDTTVAAAANADEGVVEETAAEDAAAPVAGGPVTVGVPDGEPVMANGIPVGFTVEGYPYRGDPDAPVVMFEYSDFQCPFCSRYFVQTEPAINEAYVRNGQVRVIFRDFPLVQLHPNAPAAHAASLCVAEQGAPLYWEMHNQLFRTQSDWSQNPDALAYFAGLAEEIGSDMELYTQCMDLGDVAAAVQAGVDEARSKGFSGTPSFQFVNAAGGDGYDIVGAKPYDNFAAYADALLAGEAPVNPEAAQADDAQIPQWATAEGLMPDPDNPGHTMAGDQYIGNPDAAVVVVEYSDFQCPFCQRHAETTQPILDEQFVDTDQVMWVFKHFPLTIHPQAPAAGAAAECAAEQGEFWAMKERLFATMADWSISDPSDVFVGLADELGLDTAQFAACLADGAADARVQSDMEDGAPFVRGTPTFIVLANGEGSIIPGALPVERFTEVLQQVIDGDTGSN